MTIDREGYHTVTREIVAEVGKPYTFFEKLEPRRGRLRVHVDPRGGAAVRRQAPGRHGRVRGGSAGRALHAVGGVAGLRDRHARGRVLADRDTTINVELDADAAARRAPAARSTARVAGGVAGGTLTGAQGNGAVRLDRRRRRLGGGCARRRTSAPGMFRSARSSLTITSSLARWCGAAMRPRAIFTDDGNVIAPALGGGLVLGAFAGYYAGQHLHVRPGDAALVNSGALWGSVAGGLFAISFDTSDDAPLDRRRHRAVGPRDRRRRRRAARAQLHGEPRPRRADRRQRRARHRARPGGELGRLARIEQQLDAAAATSAPQTSRSAASRWASSSAAC